MPRGDYLAWVAEDEAGTIVGGAGVHLRPILPRADAPDALEFGPEALIVNVYVDREWRRRGVARALMVAILDALASRGISRILLHSSEDGRRLYESLGFTPTNEMRLTRAADHTNTMTGTPEEALHDYLRQFETGDLEAIAPFYHLPCVFIAPQGVFAAADGTTLRGLLDEFVRRLRAQSYRRTDFSGLSVRTLASDLASCTGVFVRFNGSDQEIARTGFTYTMRCDGGRWKIVVAAVHEPSSR